MKNFMDGYLTEGCKTCKYWSNEHGCETLLPISECEHFAKMELEDEKARLKGKESKYFVHICSCGAIHFIPKEIVDSVWNENKEMLLICTNCGQGRVIGAEEHIGDESEDFEDGHDCYQCDFDVDSVEIRSEVIEDRIVTSVLTETTRNIFKCVYVDKGYRPVLKAFNQTNIATSFYNGYFSSDILVYSQNRPIRTVDMEQLIDDLGEEKCIALSGLVIPGLDWKGTKYEN